MNALVGCGVSQGSMPSLASALVYKAECLAAAGITARLIHGPICCKSLQQPQFASNAPSVLVTTVGSMAELLSAPRQRATP